MKFLADENVEKPIVDILRADGHDVLFISETTTSTIDEKLLDQANAESRLLITNDKDFGELIFLQQKISSGIVLMRFTSEKSSVKAKFMHSLLLKYEHRLMGSFTVVSEAKVRIRPLH